MMELINSLHNQFVRVNEEKIEQIKHGIPKKHGTNIYCEPFHYS